MIVGTVILALMYFAPTVIAFARGHHQKVAITLLNIFLGWTLIGWVVAIVWAAMKPAVVQSPLQA